MTGDTWTARLSEYIDGELRPDEHDALERHLGECDTCRESVASLRRVRMRAGAVADRPPRVDLWPGLAERIGVNTGGFQPVGRSGRHRRQWAFTMPQLAAAALALLAIGAGSVWFTAGPGSGGVASVTERVTTPFEFDGRLVSVISYDAAVADLERVLGENRERLDSTTVRVLEENLLIINRAIRRAREALAAEPSDAYLNTHLAETMQTKLALLRRAADIASASL